MAEHHHTTPEAERKSLTVLLKVSLAGGGQLDGNKLVATKRRVRQRLLCVNYLHREGSENFEICMRSITHPRFSKREMMGPTRPRCPSS